MSKNQCPYFRVCYSITTVLKSSPHPQNKTYDKEKLKHCAGIRHIWVLILAVYSSAVTLLCEPKLHLYEGNFQDGNVVTTS